MFSLHKSDLSALILRLVLGGTLLTHGLIKLFIFTPPGTEIYFSSIGLPATFGLWVLTFEIVAGILLIVGFLTRITSLLSLIEMIGVTKVHWPNGFTFDNPGGGWEYPVLLLVVSLVLVILGNGIYSIPVGRRSLGNY